MSDTNSTTIETQRMSKTRKQRRLEAKMARRPKYHEIDLTGISQGGTPIGTKHGGRTGLKLIKKYELEVEKMVVEEKALAEYGIDFRNAKGQLVSEQAWIVAEISRRAGEELWNGIRAHIELFGGKTEVKFGNRLHAAIKMPKPRKAKKADDTTAAKKPAKKITRPKYEVTEAVGDNPSMDELGAKLFGEKVAKTPTRRSRRSDNEEAQPPQIAANG